MTPDELLRHAARLSAPYRLAPPDRLRRGPAGGMAGASDGQSVDFHDFREYHPGDDLRRVDWRAYARHGSLHLKLFREEIAPVTEVVLDTSASMGTYPGKAQTTLFAAAFLAGATRTAEGRPILRAGARRYAGSAFEEGLARLAFEGEDGGEARRGHAGGGNAGARPWRFWLSDFLTPEGLEGRFARHAAGALALTPVLILAESERDPPERGAWRLVDAERPGQMIDLPIDEAAVTRYRERLRRHEDQLAALALRHGGRLLRMDAPDGALKPADLDRAIQTLVRARVVTAE